MSVRLLCAWLLGAALPLGAQSPNPNQPLSVQEIFGSHASKGSAPPAETSWSPDGSVYAYMSERGLVAIPLESGAERTLVSAAALAPTAARLVGEKDRDHRERYSQPGYLWSPDGKQLLFDRDGTLWLSTVSAGSLRQVGDTGQGSGDDPKFSPDGRAISYVHQHNLYTLVPGQPPIALTKTTDPALMNGEVDWVYLEELKSRTNYAWAPDSSHLVYLQMDETRVPTYPIEDWIPTHATLDLQRYPQPGDPNPSVRVGVVAATGGDTSWIDLPIRAGDDYIPRLGWADAHTIWAETLSRDHRHRAIYFADITTGRVERVWAEQDEKFLDDSYDLHFYAPGSFLLESWRDGHMHLYRYSYDPAQPLAGEAKLVAQLEKGDYEAGEVLSVDRAAGEVFYASTERVDGAPGRGNSRQVQVWAVSLDGTKKRPVTTTAGNHRAGFAKGLSSYADMASTATTQPTLSLCSAGRSCKQIWHAPAGADPNPSVMLELKAADGRTTLYASLTLPQGSAAKATVPLINNPYGGPGPATVADKWAGPPHLFDELLAQHGFAVLHVDNRGMGFRGRDFAQAAYHDFGKVQLADQLAAIDQVLARYPQLDPKRLGWWGWSWGGTFTLNALTHSGRFRAGVSVAPVTDMRNYDSIYTERYLGLPADNAAIYDAAAVLPVADRLQGRLLLIHGTGDDNVHIENTVQVIQKLIDAKLPYDLQLYPRKTHSIAGPEARTHLYSRIVEHFEHYLKPEPSAP